MGTEPDDGDYGPDEAKPRFEATLRAALNTPPKPRKDMPKKRPQAAARKQMAGRRPPPNRDAP